MNAQRQYEILVVDDEIMLASVAMRLLGNLDKDPYTHKGKFSLSTTNCGNNAIDFLRGGYTPDVILSDLNMLNGTGQELVEWIRGNRQELWQRVILMTGAPGGLADFAGQMRSEGCSVIGKPFDVQELRTAIDKVLEATKALEEAQVDLPADPEAQEEEVDPSKIETQENPIVTLRRPLPRRGQTGGRLTNEVMPLGRGPLVGMRVEVTAMRNLGREGEKPDRGDGSSEDKE